MDIIIYKLIELCIHPLKWYVIPTWENDPNLGLHVKYITIQFPYQDNQMGLVQGQKEYRYSYTTGMVIRWLCFRFQFTYWKKVKELHSIYGDNYDFTKDNQWREKYDQLCATDYFN